MALFSVHKVHNGRAGVASVRELKALVSRARDREAVAEVHLDRERLREGAARAVMARARKEDAGRAVSRAQEKRTAKALQDRRAALRQEACDALAAVLESAKNTSQGYYRRRG